MKILIGLVVIIGLAALVWLNSTEVKTESQPPTTTTPIAQQQPAAVADTMPRPQSLPPTTATEAANTPSPAPASVSWTQADLGYGDTTAYAAYSEQELIGLMEDNGDAVAATAFVERMEQQSEQGTAMHMSFLFRMVGSSAAINRILSWENMEWEFPGDQAALIVFTHLLGDGKVALPNDNLEDACEEALINYESSNGQRVQRGWVEFPTPTIPEACSE